MKQVKARLEKHLDALHNVFEAALKVITGLLATPPDHFKV